MKINRLLLLSGSSLLIALFAGSCSTHGPAFLGNTAGYMAKPVYEGKRTGAFYMSGRVNKGYTYYAGEQNNSFDFSGHVSLLWKYYYLCGGSYLYGGKYHFNALANPALSTKTYGYNGIGWRFETGGRIPLESKIDMLLGISGEFFGQRGAYEDKVESDFEDLFGDTFTLGIDGLSFACHVETRFRPTDKTTIGLRYSLDMEAGGNAEAPEGYMHLEYANRLALALSYDRFTAFGQIGFADKGQKMYSLGVAFGFPFWKNK